MRARNRGVCAEIKKVLAAGGKRYTEVCDALPQFSRSTISASLGTLVRMLFVMKGGDKKNRTYIMRVPDACPVVRPSDRPKGLPKYIPPMRPLQRSKQNDAFARWRLCERDPLETSNSAVFTVPRG